MDRNKRVAEGEISRLFIIFELNIRILLFVNWWQPAHVQQRAIQCKKHQDTFEQE